MNPKQLNTAEWQRLDSQHYLHPFTDHKALARKGSRIITRAEGIYLFDSDGTDLGRVTLPSRFRPEAVERLRVVGVWTDELDVEYVVRFEVLPSGAAGSSG